MIEDVKTYTSVPIGISVLFPTKTQIIVCRNKQGRTQGFICWEGAGQLVTDSLIVTSYMYVKEIRQLSWFIQLPVGLYPGLSILLCNLFISNNVMIMN